jgi:hypothetical protein
MSVLPLAELIYEQAQKALEQQERQVNELRQRMGTLLGAAALTASFFGTAALGRDGASLPVILAGVALAVTVLSSLFALYPYKMEFATDARRLYDALQSEQDPERLHLLLAFGLRDVRTKNGRRVDWLARSLSIAALGLVTQIACWTWALAIL